MWDVGGGGATHASHGAPIPQIPPQNTLSRLSVWLVGWPAARETLLLWLRTLVEVMVRHSMAAIVEEVVVDVLPKVGDDELLL